MDDIKVERKETGCEGEEVIHVAQDLVSTVKGIGNFWLGEKLVAFEEGICFMTEITGKCNKLRHEGLVT